MPGRIPRGIAGEIFGKNLYVISPGILRTPRGIAPMISLEVYPTIPLIVPLGMPSSIIAWILLRFLKKCLLKKKKPG